MRILKATTVLDWHRSVVCPVCASQLQIDATDVRAVNLVDDPESPPEWEFGVVCPVCEDGFPLTDAPLPSYVRNAAVARAREG